METPHLEKVLDALSADVRRLRDLHVADSKTVGTARAGSRFVGPGAEPSVVEHIAAGGELRVAEPRSYSDKGGLARSLKALSEGMGSSGGYVTFPELSAEITPLLRARSVVLRLGARIIPVHRELDVAALSTGAVAHWTAENAPIVTSDETFALSVLLRPRALAALVAVSQRLLDDAVVNPSLEAVLRDDLAQVLGLAADLAFLRGSGLGMEPLGLRNFPGVNAIELGSGDGASVDFDALKEVVASLRAINAPFTSPGWAMNARTLSTLERIKTTYGTYLATPDLLSFDPTGATGRLLGFPVYTSSQIPVSGTVGTSNDCSEIYFSSDWNELYVGQQAALTIDSSPEASYTPDGTSWVSAFQTRQVLFRAVTLLDAAPRRPQLFAVVTGVRP